MGRHLKATYYLNKVTVVKLFYYFVSIVLLERNSL